MKHAIVYVTGLGDMTVSGRQAAVSLWHIYGVRAIVHPMRWADKQPFAPKLAALLQHIDSLNEQGYKVSLVGESAGASAVLAAYAVRQDAIHRVAFICGKLHAAHAISSYTYEHNPAFAESMLLLDQNMASIDEVHRARMLSVHPLADASVPIADTYIEGGSNQTIPTKGHALSIALGITIFSWKLVGFLKRPLN